MHQPSRINAGFGDERSDVADRQIVKMVEADHLAFFAPPRAHAEKDRQTG